MKKLVIVTLLLLLAVLTYAEDKKFGKEITLNEKTNLSAILENPEQFVGQKVLIEGTVINVCETRGCWIDIAAGEGYEKIRVKVDDGVIVFPMEAKGKNAVVEGEVYAVAPQHNCSGSCAEESKEAENHDCENEKEMTKIYQIKGSGAVIEM